MRAILLGTRIVRARGSKKKRERRREHRYVVVGCLWQPFSQRLEMSPASADTLLMQAVGKDSNPFELRQDSSFMTCGDVIKKCRILYF